MNSFKEDWSKYSLLQLDALVESAQAHTLERTELKQIIRELIRRCREVEAKAQ